MIVVAQNGTGELPLGHEALDRAIERALGELQTHQAETGAWLGDYSGPLFLLPMYIATCYGIGEQIPADVAAEMVRYMRNTQNADGGWGLHVESHSYLFTTTTVYVALRLCGVSSDDPALIMARAFIHRNGSPLASASWGKYLLSLLNLYDYRGLIPVPPEMWLLPERLPLHPSHTWCQTRMTSLPMAYLYGKRICVPENELIRELRAELYPTPYAQIAWEGARERVAKSDDYRPLDSLAKGVARLLGLYEALPFKPLRRPALEVVLDHIRAEDRNSQYVCLNPLVKLYHLWVWHHVDAGGPEVRKHLERLPEYLWQGEDGLKVQGYHSSQLWDTAFAVQAMLATGDVDRCRGALEAANGFIDNNQVREDLPEREKYYRDPTKGGWGFSNKDNGWIVSDTTAEGLRAALALRAHVTTPLSKERLRDAVDYLLWSQTESGGWASYEPTRGPAWLERLNYSNVFGEIMIDYPYVECTAAALLGLVQYRAAYPGDRDLAIARALERGRSYLFSQQRQDGSFEGSWGICFTYGTWFGIEGLRALGLDHRHERIQRACSFLQQHQLPDGGWGETAESNYYRRYVHAEHGQAVMTAWAVLGLIAGGCARSAAVSNGVRFLIDVQREDGSYAPEHIAGMFNKTCAIQYDNYLKIFPLWALAQARSHWHMDRARH
jgi:squalene/oxidosqualene cyclase-like protein